VRWLERFLIKRFPKADVKVQDTHSIPLNRYLSYHQLTSYFNDQVSQTYEIQVDVVGTILHKTRQELAFVECKLKPITLSDLSQLLGYSRVALPRFSFLISPKGIKGSLSKLLLSYGRTDILEYHWPKGEQARAVTLAKWNSKNKMPEQNSIIPLGNFV